MKKFTILVLFFKCLSGTAQVVIHHAHIHTGMDTVRLDNHHWNINKARGITMKIAKVIHSPMDTVAILLVFSRIDRNDTLPAFVCCSIYDPKFFMLSGKRKQIVRNSQILDGEIEDIILKP